MQHGKLAFTAFNMHPGGNVDKRTNLYLLQTDDLGRTWRNVAGEPVTVPLATPENPALVRNYRDENRLVYIHDLNLDRQGRPVILYITSASYKPGPEGDPRWWTIAHWTGKAWEYSRIGPRQSQLQHRIALHRGHRMAGDRADAARAAAHRQRRRDRLWTSGDEGKTWTKQRDITQPESAESQLRATTGQRPSRFLRLLGRWQSG